MNQIILYGTQYGAARNYAEELSQLTNTTAISYKDATNLIAYDTIVYIGSLYAGSVVGLKKTFKNYTLPPQQRILIATVGLAPPESQENTSNIKKELSKQLPTDIFSKATLFHLRAGIDYPNLSFIHSIMMKGLVTMLKQKPLQDRTPDIQSMIDTYGKKLDYTDFKSLTPIVEAIKNWKAALGAKTTPKAAIFICLRNHSSAILW